MTNTPGRTLQSSEQLNDEDLPLANAVNIASLTRMNASIKSTANPIKQLPLCGCEPCERGDVDSKETLLACPTPVPGMHC